MDEGIGEAFREAFEAKLEVLGNTFVIRHSCADTKSSEVVGLRTHEKTKTPAFEFLDPIDVKTGSIIQIKGGRDFWRVVDTEDVIEYGAFINFKVYVEKVDISGQPTRPSVTGGDTFNLEGAHSRVNIQSQDNSVNVFHQSAENIFADIRHLIQTHIADDVERTEILNRLNELEAAKGSDRFSEKYQSFIASAANHMTVLAPFIPALTQMLAG
jgi:hypothetical protein